MRGKGNEAVFTLSVIPRKMWGIDLIFTNFYILSKEDYVNGKFLLDMESLVSHF